MKEKEIIRKVKSVKNKENFTIENIFEECNLEIYRELDEWILILKFLGDYGDRKEEIVCYEEVYYNQIEYYVEKIMEYSEYAEEQKEIEISGDDEDFDCGDGNY